MNTCAWCNKQIGEDEECYGMGAKARAGMDLREAEGTIVDIWVESAERSVPAIVVVSGSDAKKDGHDMIFMTCGRGCAEELRNALVADGIEPKKL